MRRRKHKNRRKQLSRAADLDLSPGDIDLAQRTAMGAEAVKIWAEEINEAGLNDPILASMGIALMQSIQEYRRGENDEDMATAVGMAMVAAYSYGKKGSG